MKKILNIINKIGGIYLLPLAIALIGFILIDVTSSWINLTIAGLTMGLMFFLMASGLSLTFGLMGVLNFGHPAFITLGAYIAVSVLSALGSWLTGNNIFLMAFALFSAIAAAIMLGIIAGWFFESIIIKPVYQDHLRQILITMGALIVVEQIVLTIWGGTPITVLLPNFLRDTWIWGDVSISIYRIYALLLGIIVFLGLYFLLQRTRIGLLIRAGVENREMVEALGYHIDRLFLLVFIIGSALAALGGVMWAGYQTLITPAMGTEVLIIVFIIVIIGGLGSVTGTLVGAIIVGLVANYVGYLAPKLALASNMLIMMIILLWRPKGLLPIIK